jgi:hypothetical protein
MQIDAHIASAGCILMNKRNYSGGAPWQAGD